MQLLKKQKHVTFLFTLAFCIMSVNPSAYANNAAPAKQPTTLTRTVGTTALITSLACFLRLVTKKTQPKRVYPKDDSLLAFAWYFFDEILTGQMEKGDRASKVVIDDLNNPHELTIQYSKIEARGVAGILYSTFKPVIIPALTLMIMFNEDFMKKSANGINAMVEFSKDPAQPFTTFWDAVKPVEK